MCVAFNGQGKRQTAQYTERVIRGCMCIIRRCFDVLLIFLFMRQSTLRFFLQRNYIIVRLDNHNSMNTICCSFIFQHYYYFFFSRPFPQHASLCYFTSDTFSIISFISLLFSVNLLSNSARKARYSRRRSGIICSYFRAVLFYQK